MKLTTKYNIGDSVWVINGKKGDADQIEVQGLITQYLVDNQKTIYSFIKDRSEVNGKLRIDPVTEQEKYFWLSEDKCYEKKEELLNSL